MSEYLKRIQRELKDQGRSAKPTSAQYLAAIQDVKVRMNEAKLAAMKAASLPFDAELNELEDEYAIFLNLSS